MAKFNAGSAEALGKQAEAIGIYQAVMDGSCDACPHFEQCAGAEAFRFPPDAACTQKKAAILKKWEVETDV